MSSRTEMFAALQAQAESLGWQVLEPYDNGCQVEMMLVADGACEQVVTGTMLQARKQLNAMTGPEDYPAIEEYDLPSDGDYEAEQAEIAEVLAEDDALAMLDAQIEAVKDTRQMLVDLDVITPEIEAEWETLQALATELDISVEEAADQLAYTENDPEWGKFLEQVEAEDKAAEEAELGEPAAGVQGSSKTEDGPYTALAAADLAQAADEEAMDSVRDAEASEAEQARDERLETEALEPEYARTDDAAGEAEAALTVAVDALSHQQFVWSTRLERAREALRNVVENGHEAGDGLHEDISPFLVHENERPSMKSLWREEVARPEQFLTEVQMAGKGRRIIARKGDEVLVFLMGIEQRVRKALVKNGYSFFSVTQERANVLARGGRVTAQRSGRVVSTMVNGRDVAPEGYRLQVSKLGHHTQCFKSIDPSVWVPRGFQVQLVEAGA